jgi:hypothetical protein
MGRQYIGDISVLSAASIDLLGIFENVTLALTAAKTDVSLTNRITKSNQTTKKSGRISTRVMTTISDSLRVSHLNLTAMTLDGTNVLAYVRSMTFNGVFEHQMASGIGEMFEKPEVVQKGYTATVEIEADTDTIAAFATNAASTTGADSDMVLTFTINAIAYSFKMTMDEFEYGTERNGMQMATITLSSRDGDTGASPTAPTTSTVLLDKALNDPRTLVAYSFTGKSADSFNAAGNMCWDSFGFTVTDGEVTYIDYAWRTNGAMTITPN